ncbi:MAG: hypothetical protein RL557_705 [archaeon]|jgi:hypothetical protein
MNKKYLNEISLSVKDIARTLYDFSTTGGIVIPHVLTENARNDLMEVIDSLRNYFVDAPKREGNVIQNLQHLYIENNQLMINNASQKILDTLVEEYTPFYEALAEVAQFTNPAFNSLGFHKYPTGMQGITPHRDYKSDRDLISIFIIKGKAPFYLHVDKQGNGAVELDSSPGNLILMRAARNPGEQKFRPTHSVGIIEEERYSFIIRHREIDDRA